MTEAVQPWKVNAVFGNMIAGTMTYAVLTACKHTWSCVCKL